MGKFIVTGANGQLGQYLIKYILDTQSNLDIIGTLRHKSYDKQPYIFDKNKIRFELMDLSDAHSIENLIIKYRPEYFVNTAANAFVGESWNVPIQQIELNTLGVLHQLESIRKHSPDTRYFTMGTSEEFGNDTNDGKLQNENTIINPKSPYGCAKAASRYLVNVYRQSYGLYAIQGWTFNFESFLRGEKYVTKKITKNVARIKYCLDNNKSFTPLELGNLNSYRSWQFCGDVADGIWRQLNQENYSTEIMEKITSFWNDSETNSYIKFLSKYIKPYVMSASSCHTVKEFVETAFARVNVKGTWHGEGKNQTFIDNTTEKILVSTNEKYFRPHDVSYLNGDASLIRKELGWKSSLTFEQLVHTMVDYDMEHFEENLI